MISGHLVLTSIPGHVRSCRKPARSAVNFRSEISHGAACPKLQNTVCLIDFQTILTHRKQFSISSFRDPRLQTVFPEAGHRFGNRQGLSAFCMASALRQSGKPHKANTPSLLFTPPGAVRAPAGFRET